VWLLLYFQWDSPWLHQLRRKLVSLFLALPTCIHQKLAHLGSWSENWENVLGSLSTHLVSAENVTKVCVAIGPSFQRCSFKATCPVFGHHYINRNIYIIRQIRLKGENTHLDQSSTWHIYADDMFWKISKTFHINNLSLTFQNAYMLYISTF
jgi:hypothetical protein